MKEFNCDQCNKKFKAFPSHRRGKFKFCKYACKKLFQTGKHHVGNTSRCVICNKKYWIKPYAIQRGRRCCSWKCRSELLKRKTGQKSPKWKGGTQKHSGGYLEQPHTQLRGRAKRILQHRRVMEEYLGRKLLRKEVVHHVDGNKKNNEIENLELMTLSEHSKYHALKRLRVII